MSVSSLRLTKPLRGNPFAIPLAMTKMSGMTPKCVSIANNSPVRPNPHWIYDIHYFVINVANNEVRMWNLVGYKQYIVLGADLSQALQKTLGWDHISTFSLFGVIFEYANTVAAILSTKIGSISIAAVSDGAVCCLSNTSNWSRHQALQSSVKQQVRYQYAITVMNRWYITGVADRSMNMIWKWSHKYSTHKRSKAVSIYGLARCQAHGSKCPSMIPSLRPIMKMWHTCL